MELFVQTVPILYDIVDGLFGQGIICIFIHTRRKMRGNPERIRSKRNEGTESIPAVKRQKRKGAIRPNTSNITKVDLLVNDFLCNPAKIYI
jgi:hypothetical protein